MVSQGDHPTPSTTVRDEMTINLVKWLPRGYKPEGGKTCVKPREEITFEANLPNTSARYHLCGGLVKMAAEHELSERWLIPVLVHARNARRRDRALKATPFLCRNRQHCVDDAGIKPRLAFGGDVPARVGEAHRASANPIERGQRVQAVGHRADPSTEGNLLPFQPVRIAGSIVAFMMCQHDGRHVVAMMEPCSAWHNRSRRGFS